MSFLARLQRHLCRFAMLSICPLLVSSACAQTTRNVPQDFSTIQAAINASTSGDTISVATGTYTENLVLTGKSVHLVSTAGAATTILDGSFAGPVLTISNISTMESSLTGFTVQHGLATSASHGAAGVVLAQSGAVLANNRFLHNSGNNIGVFYGTVSVLNNSLSTAPSDQGSGNNCDGGDGISVFGSSPVYDASSLPLPSTITGNTISGDSTRCSGTGIHLETVSFVTPHLVANNIVRNSALGLKLGTDTGAGGGVIVRQNLIYDNANGAIALIGPATPPSTDPAIVLVINNTIVNNLNQPATSPLSEITLTGTAAHTAFINNILVGTTANPVLTCDLGSPSYNDTPLILDHTDLYNTTQSPGGLIAGDCAAGISGQLASNGNLSVDPRLNNSTDLHLSTNSPAIDAGTNSAPSLANTDLDGNPRIVDATALGFATVDLGAYEAAGTADSGSTAISLTASSYLTAPTTLTLTAISTAPDGSHPAGTISFAQQGTALSAIHTDSTGTATLAVPLATPGVAAFTAAFTPDAAVAPTISPVLYVDVTAASTTVASTLTVAANPTTLTATQSTTVTIHLGSTNGGGAIPTGPVSLMDNGNLVTTLQPDPTTGSATVTLTHLTVGLHTLVATYAGNSSFTPAASTTSLTVTALLPSTLSITATSQTGFAHQPLLLTILLGSLTTTNAAGPIPPGALTLYTSTTGSSALTLLTTLQPDSSGNVSYTIADPPSGNVSYTVRYAGDTTYAASSASTSLALTAPAATMTTLVASPNPAILGSTVTLTATVSNTSVPASPSLGAVRFTDGPTLLGTATVGSANTATFSVSHLALGAHVLLATFVPAPAFAASSGSANVTILRAATTTTLSSAQNPASTTDLVTYTATVTLSSGVTGPAPTGTITLTDGAALLASGTLSPLSALSSTVTLTAADTTVGSRNLLATYTPAPAGLAPSSGTLVETITAVPTPSVTLSATPNPATILNSIALTVTLTNVPAGASLSLLDGATPLPLPSTPASGSYTLPAGALTIGTHTLSAVLRDTHANLIGSSTPITERIVGLTSTLSLTAAPAPTALVGASVTLAAALTSTMPPGHVPTGSVTFLDGPLVLGSNPIDATGHASLLTTTLTAGAHTLSAKWSGDDLLSAATATALTEQILTNPTTTSLTIANPGTTAFAPVTLSAQVQSPASTPINTAVCTPACAPTAVTFFAQTSAGQTPLGTVSVDSTGRASLTAHPEAGSVTFSAAFSGSPLFGPSTSPTVPDTVLIAPSSLSLTGSPNPLYQRGSVTLTAILSAAVGIPSSALAAAPITLLEGTTALGTITSPFGTLAYTPATTGTHTLVAVFAGTPNLAPASATLVVTVLPSDFTVTVHDTALTIQTEHHAPTTVAIAVTGDLADTIDLTCDSPPAIVSCTFTPASMALNPANNPTATAQLIVDTDFIQRWANLRRPSVFNTPGSALSTLAATLALSFPTTWLLALRRRTTSRAPHTASPNPQPPARPQRHSPLPNLLAALLLSAVALGVSACGSTQPGHTPPGAYPLTITAHARTHRYSHTATVTLTVMP